MVVVWAVVVVVVVVVVVFVGTHERCSWLFFCVATCDGAGIVQAALWPMLATAVPLRLVGTGMGIAAAASNGAMVVFPFITGMLHDMSGNYLSAMYLFVGADTFCIVVILIVLWR